MDGSQTAGKGTNHHDGKKASMASMTSIVEVDRRLMSTVASGNYAKSCSGLHRTPRGASLDVALPSLYLSSDTPPPGYLYWPTGSEKKNPHTQTELQAVKWSINKTVKFIFSFKERPNHHYIGRRGGGHCHAQS